MAASAKPEIKAFFDEPTNTVSYLVWDPATKEGAVIDPVLNFDHRSGEADRGIRASDTCGGKKARGQNRADSGNARARRSSVGRALYQAENRRYGRDRRAYQGCAEDLPAHLQRRSTYRAMARNSIICSRTASASRSAQSTAEVIYTPGHTPACVSYKIGDAVFVGDTMFMPDYGTARADFPGGDARDLYRSIQRILSLPKETRLFMCHDYKAPGRDQYAWETTVGEEKARNVHVHEGVPKMNLSRCAKRVTPRWRRLCCCCPRFRSTFVPASFRRLKPMACTTSRYP